MGGGVMSHDWPEVMVVSGTEYRRRGPMFMGEHTYVDPETGESELVPASWTVQYLNASVCGVEGCALPGIYASVGWPAERYCDADERRAHLGHLRMALADHWEAHMRGHGEAKRDG